MMFEEQDVFNIGSWGRYGKFRIPGIVVTKMGSVLLTVEARYGSGADWDNSDILMRKSVDDGDTFEDPVLLLSHVDFDNGPINNFVMIAHAESNRVTAVFCSGYSKVFSMFSDDDATTFSSPVEITSVIENFRDEYPWKVCATGPGHSIQLDDGRIIVPIWLSDGTGREFGSGRLGHRPSILTVIYSDDFGSNWLMGDILCSDGDYFDGIRITNPSETVAVQKNDRTVMFNIRTESSPNRRLIVTSDNGVFKFQINRFDDYLLESVCMGSLLRYKNHDENKKDYLIFINPNNLQKTHEGELISDPVPGSSRDRKRLTVKLSRDDGETWSFGRVIEEGPSGYSDIAQSSKGDIFCLYEFGSKNEFLDDVEGSYLVSKNQFTSVRFCKFNFNWITKEVSEFS